MEKFKKSDEGKIDFNLITPDFLKEVAEILTKGASEYGKNNWRRCKEPDRFNSAVMRHWNEYRRGVKVDKDSKKSHLAHIVCSLMFLFELDNKTAFSGYCDKVKQPQQH